MLGNGDRTSDQRVIEIPVVFLFIVTPPPRPKLGLVTVPLVPSVDAVSNNAKHHHHGPKQPNHHPDVLPRVFDIVVGAAAVLVLLSVRKEAQ